MQDIRIDDNGDQRCWNCGGKHFTLKRTARSKAAVGLAALATKKKLKCQGCGKYNQVGNAKKFSEPAPTMGTERSTSYSIPATHSRKAAAQKAKENPNAPVWQFQEKPRGWVCIAHDKHDACYMCGQETHRPMLWRPQPGDEYPSTKYPRK